MISVERVVSAKRSSLTIHADVALTSWNSVDGAACSVWPIKNLPRKAGRVMGKLNIPTFGVGCIKNLADGVKDIQLHESLK